MWDGESVTQCTLQRTRTSLSKKCQVAMPEILESGSDTMRVWKTPKGSWKEQVLWKIAHVLEQLVGEQMGIWEEMVMIWEFSERQEDILQDLVDQTKALSDAMELFT